MVKWRVVHDKRIMSVKVRRCRDSSSYTSEGDNENVTDVGIWNKVID